MNHEPAAREALTIDCVAIPSISRPRAKRLPLVIEIFLHLLGLELLPQTDLGLMIMIDRVLASTESFIVKNLSITAQHVTECPVPLDHARREARSVLECGRLLPLSRHHGIITGNTG